VDHIFVDMPTLMAFILQRGRLKFGSENAGVKNAERYGRCGKCRRRVIWKTDNV